mgnify:FL=1
MIYRKGMLCKHFKGESLLEKNIYEILKVNVNGKDIDENNIIYTGNGNLKDSVNLVIYKNIFQNDKVFAREYNDISSYLTKAEKIKYNQDIKVQPLTEEEINVIYNESFIKEKKNLTLKKFKK